MKKSILLVIAALLFMASPVMAKEGFYIGAFVPITSVDGDAGSVIDSGTGWGFRAGVRANRYFAVEASYGVTKNDVTGYSSADLKGLAGDVKVNFPLTSLDSAQIMTVEPYLMAGYAHYEINKPTKVKSNGFQWGFGVELYLFRELSINAGWTQTSVSWDTPTQSDAGGHIRTVDFGIMYHFI